ncbi:CAP domain-containing protein [Streptomyces sp. NBRC 110611]|uniref:CAP domain-containing protein n=1 Tax=Streptomyces sp. NBRC 110611 TaxID=1621259 RepID=UPI00099FD55A|nr:CAP domain-containing protein [Streptomyces sp. NBRC 110611]
MNHHDRPASHRRSAGSARKGRNGGTHRAGASRPRWKAIVPAAGVIAVGCCSLVLIRLGSGPDQELAANRSLPIPPSAAPSGPPVPRSGSSAPAPSTSASGSSPSPSSSPGQESSATPSDAERQGKRDASQRKRQAGPGSGSDSAGNTAPRTSGSGSGAGRTTTPAGPGAVTGTAAEFARKVVELVNAQRAEHGCGPLTIDLRLQRAAQAHSDDMAARDYYDHNTPEGVDPGTRITNAGFRWSSWAENIFKSPKDPATALEGWMDSPGHRANILNCSYKSTGVGVNLSSNGPWWTQEFATRS